jgi:hypothetical protein
VKGNAMNIDTIYTAKDLANELEHHPVRVLNEEELASVWGGQCMVCLDPESDPCKKNAVQDNNDNSSSDAFACLSAVQSQKNNN